MCNSQFWVYKHTWLYLASSRVLGIHTQVLVQQALSVTQPSPQSYNYHIMIHYTCQFTHLCSTEHLPPPQLFCSCETDLLHLKKLILKFKYNYITSSFLHCTPLFTLPHCSFSQILAYVSSIILNMYPEINKDPFIVQGHLYVYDLRKSHLPMDRQYGAYSLEKTPPLSLILSGLWFFALG